jgi:predicted nucleotide-binding protein
VQKIKNYQGVRFSADVLEQGGRKFIEIAKAQGSELSCQMLSVDHFDCQWGYDDVPEFFADYRRYSGCAQIYLSAGLNEFQIQIQGRAASLRVRCSSRSEIESVFEIFEANLAQSALVNAPFVPLPPPSHAVFIGHGRSGAWRELKDHLQDKHKIEVVAYETGARAGHSIRDILDDMARKSTFALLVLTAEDQQPDGSMRARQNVIHEAGVFQGRLGFQRAIMLLEEGVEDFSNAAGIQYIKFSKGNIKEVFGEVLATLKRESEQQERFI